jgi:hypothetical protein
MSFFYNKLQNAYINTTSNTSYLISSTYESNNSLVNKGKTEFENNVVVDTKLAVGKAINATYAVDVSGNVNFSGDLYKNGVVYNPASSILDTSNNWSQLNTFNNNVVVNTNLAVGKSTDASYALDVSGNVNLSGILTKSGVAYDASFGKLDVSNNWTQSNTFVAVDCSGNLNARSEIIFRSIYNPFSIFSYLDTNAASQSYTLTTPLPANILIDMSNTAYSTTTRVITFNLPKITTSMLGLRIAFRKYCPTSSYDNNSPITVYLQPASGDGYNLHQGTRVTTTSGTILSSGAGLVGSLTTYNVVKCIDPTNWAVMY